jgi:hypothetical protein
MVIVTISSARKGIEYRLKIGREQKRQEEQSRRAVKELLVNYHWSFLNYQLVGVSLVDQAGGEGALPPLLIISRTTSKY